MCVITLFQLFIGYILGLAIPFFTVNENCWRPNLVCRLAVDFFSIQLSNRKKITPSNNALSSNYANSPNDVKKNVNDFQFRLWTLIFGSPSSLKNWSSFLKLI